MASSAGNTVIGRIVVLYTFKEGWIAVFIIGMVLMGLLSIYQKLDKKRFQLLYRGRNV